MTDSSAPSLTFDQSASKQIIEGFGWEVDEDGVIISSSGDWIPSYSGEKAHLDEFAGIVKGPEGKPLVLRENFAELADYVGDHRDQ